MTKSKQIEALLEINQEIRKQRHAEKAKSKELRAENKALSEENERLYSENTNLLIELAERDKLKKELEQTKKESGRLLGKISQFDAALSKTNELMLKMAEQYGKSVAECDKHFQREEFLRKANEALFDENTKLKKKSKV